MPVLKRMLEQADVYPQTDTAHYDNSNYLSSCEDALAPPPKRRKMRIQTLTLLAEGKPNHSCNDNTVPITNSLRNLNISPSIESDKENCFNSTSMKPDPLSEGETTQSSTFNQQDPSGFLRLSNLTLGVYLQIDIQSFILIKPSFAKGGYAHCSVWLGVNDRKLYVRKLQMCSDQVPRDISHQISHPNVPALVASIKHGLKPQVLSKTFSCSNELNEIVNQRQGIPASMN